MPNSKQKVRPKKQPLFCDPAACSHCEYIGEGDFICDKSPTHLVVVTDWLPTPKYMWCRKKGGNKNGKHS